MSSTPDSYLFYGFRWKETGVPDWLYQMKDDLDEELTLYEIVNDEEKPVKQGFGCHIGTCGYDEDPQLILAAGPMCFGTPRPDKKPVRFYVSFDYDPVKVEIHHSPEWDVRLHQAADYLNWPKEDREIGWWLVTKF